MSRAWVIRSGRSGERDEWALNNGVSGGGWWEIPDLTSATSRELVGHLVAQTFPKDSEGRIANYTGQLWALRGRIEVGDLLVMPLKTTKQIALGRVTGGYEYLAEEPDPNKRHVVRVDWRRTDLPRTAVKQDLLFTLGSVLSVFSPSRGNAYRRLERLLADGVDPGQSSAAVALQPGTEAQVQDLDDVDAPEQQTDIEEAAYNQILARISEDFAGHDLATLITGLLEAQGLNCRQSPPGPDGGIDIVAGRGVLGLDDPILVQVKSGGAVGHPVVSQLQGVMASLGARQGLLVAWGGVTKPARDALKQNQLSVRVWEAADVVDGVLARYEQLDEDIKAKLPLKRVWMLAE
jgi:restriction system protein